MLHQWIKQYEIFGKNAFEKPYTAYPAQFKLDVLNYMNEQGTSIRETAAIFNIPSYETLRKKVECLSSKQGKITIQDKAQIVYELRHEFPEKSTFTYHRHSV
jgi:hypothetical protein